MDYKETVKPFFHCNHHISPISDKLAFPVWRVLTSPPFQFGGVNKISKARTPSSSASNHHFMGTSSFYIYLSSWVLPLNLSTLGETEHWCVFVHKDPLLALYVLWFWFSFLIIRFLNEFLYRFHSFGCVKRLLFYVTAVEIKSVLSLGILAEAFTNLV